MGSRKKSVRKHKQQPASSSFRANPPVPSRDGRLAFIFNHSALLYGVALAFATGLLYWHTLENPPVFDDLPFFRDGALETLASGWFDFSRRWFYFASLHYTYVLFGDDIFWYRAGNVLLHAATVIALFMFLRRLLVATSNGATTRSMDLPAFAAAMMFALHPVSVYGVAYLAERSIVMATLFSLLALIAFLKGLLEQRTHWLWGAVAFYFVALFSKEHSVTLPAVMLALALLLRSHAALRSKQIGGVLLVMVLLGTWVVFLNRSAIGTAYEPYAQNLLGQVLPGQPGTDVTDAHWRSAITQGLLFFKYLLLWLIPYPDCMSVDMRVPFAAGLFEARFGWGAMAFLAYALAGGWLLSKQGKAGVLGFGLLFPWLMFASELSTIRVQEPFVLYRSYLWMAGFAAVPALMLSHMRARYTLLALAAVCSLLTVAAWNRLDTFSSDLKLWDDAARLNQGKDDLPGSERIYYARGGAYTNLGRHEEAMRDYDHMIAIAPAWVDAPYYQRGWGHLRLSQAAQAYSDFSRVIKLQPQFADAYIDRAVSLIMMSRYTEAKADAEHALALTPDHARGLQVLAEVYLRLADEMRAEKRPAEAQRYQTLHLEMLGKSCNLGFAHACALLKTRLRSGQ